MRIAAIVLCTMSALLNAASGNVGWMLLSMAFLALNLFTLGETNDNDE
jgi:hypothetical protein